MYLNHLFLFLTVIIWVDLILSTRAEILETNECAGTDSSDSFNGMMVFTPGNLRTVEHVDSFLVSLFLSTCSCLSPSNSLRCFVHLNNVGS